MSIDVNDEILQDCLVEAGEILEQLSEQLVDLEQQPDDFDLLNEVFRGFHTIKGDAGFLSIESWVEVCHRAEDLINVLRQGERSIVSELMDSILEVLDVVNSMFDGIRQDEMPGHAEPGLIQRHERFSEAVLTPKPEPSEKSPVAEKPTQKAQVELNGDSKHDLTDDEFENLLDQIRNKGHFNTAVVREGEAGVKAEPAAQSKPSSAFDSSSAVVTARKESPTSSDDSNTAIASKVKPAVETTVRVDMQRRYEIMNMVGELVLVRKRLSTLKAIMNDDDIANAVSNLDVVKTRVAQMNGSVEFDSEMGRGTQIRIKLPLTLAILPTLMVALGKQPFVLSLASVVEIFNLDLKRTNVVDNQLTIMVRQRALPLFHLRQWLVPNTPIMEQDKHDRHLVIVNVGNIQLGLVVDDLIGQEEVVIKPLGAMLQGLEGMAGATITGDGKIVLIIDGPGLMRKYARKF